MSHVLLPSTTANLAQLEIHVMRATSMSLVFLMVNVQSVITDGQQKVDQISVNALMTVLFKNL